MVSDFTQSDRLGVKTSRTREIYTCQDRRSDVLLYVCCLPFNLWILVTPLASFIFLFPIIDTLLRASGAGLKIMSTFTFGFGFMVFNATFNNISAILWRSVLLEKETRVPRENHLSVASNWQTYAYSMLNNKVCNLFFVFFYVTVCTFLECTKSGISHMIKIWMMTV